MTLALATTELRNPAHRITFERAKPGHLLVNGDAVIDALHHQHNIPTDKARALTLQALDQLGGHAEEHDHESKAPGTGRWTRHTQRSLVLHVPT